MEFCEIVWAIIGSFPPFSTTLDPPLLRSLYLLDFNWSVIKRPSNWLFAYLSLIVSLILSLQCMFCCQLFESFKLIVCISFIDSVINIIITVYSFVANCLRASNWLLAHLSLTVSLISSLYCIGYSLSEIIIIIITEQNCLKLKSMFSVRADCGKKEINLKSKGIWILIP